MVRLLDTNNYFPLQMNNRPPLRPGFPPGNIHACRPNFNQNVSSQTFSSRPSTSQNRQEVIRFGEHEMTVYPPSCNLFRVFSHIALNKEEKVLIDNLWMAYGRNPKDLNYFIACLNSLAEYFNQTSKRFKFYVVFKGRQTGFMHTWLEVLDSIQGVQDPLYKGFNNYQEAIMAARQRLGNNFFISPSLRNYTEPPLDFSVARDNNQILFCDHCETLTKNFKILNDDNTQLRNEKLLLQKHIASLERQLLEFSLAQNKGSSSGPIQKIEMGGHSPTNVIRGTVEPKRSTASPASPVAGKDSSNPFTGGHSPMNVERGIIDPKKSMASPTSPVVGKDISNPETAMGLPKSQETQRTLDSSTSQEPFSDPFSSSNTQTPQELFSENLDSIQSCQIILDKLKDFQKEASSSSKKKLKKKKVKFSKPRFQKEIDRIIKETIQDFVPRYTQNSNSEASPSEESSPDKKVGSGGSYPDDSDHDSGFSFDSVARHNLDT